MIFKSRKIDNKKPCHINIINNNNPVLNHALQTQKFTTGYVPAANTGYYYSIISPLKHQDKTIAYVEFGMRADNLFKLASKAGRYKYALYLKDTNTKSEKRELGKLVASNSKIFNPATRMIVRNIEVGLTFGTTGNGSVDLEDALLIARGGLLLFESTRDYVSSVIAGDLHQSLLNEYTPSQLLDYSVYSTIVKEDGTSLVPKDVKAVVDLWLSKTPTVKIPSVTASTSTLNKVASYGAGSNLYQSK